MKILDAYSLKLAFLCTLAYAIGEFIGAQYPYYLMFGLLVAVTPTIGQSFQESTKRILGIISGGFIATIISTSWNINSIVVSLGSGLTVLFCYAIGAPQLITKAGSTFLIVSIGHGTEVNQFYWERFVDNSLGVILGTIANIFFPPPRAVEQLGKKVSEVLVLMGDLYKAIVNRYLNQTLSSESEFSRKMEKEIQGLIGQNADLLKSTQIEMSQEWGRTNLEWQKISHLSDQIQTLVVRVQELDQVVEDGASDFICQLFSSELFYLVEVTHETFQLLGKTAFLNASNHGTTTFPDLSQAMAALDSKIAAFHFSEHNNTYTLDEVIRFSAFIDELRVINNQLKDLTESLILKLT
ncbi:MAG: aromatic acid exporter family protein [Microcoleaceae cyanobacterium]